MQDLDPTGEYTDAEVIDALTAQRGTRNLTFRFDRLNAQNQLIEASIDGILDGKVANNALAEIKRVAEFEILDGISLDYASERLMPWARIEIPRSTPSSPAYVADPADAGTFIPGG